MLRNTHDPHAELGQSLSMCCFGASLSKHAIKRSHPSHHLCIRLEHKRRLVCFSSINIRRW